MKRGLVVIETATGGVVERHDAAIAALQGVDMRTLDDMLDDMRSAHEWDDEARRREVAGDYE